MNTLHCWSGGCDSTLALYEALVYRRDQNRDFNVRSISIVEPCVPANVYQHAARVALIAEFKRRGLELDHTELRVSRSGAAYPKKMPFGSSQPLLWVGLASPCLHEDEDLVLGWIQGEFDNVAHMRSAFDALQRVQKKSGQLAFPLAGDTKYSVIDRLRTAGLLDLCWYCEGCEPGCSCDGRGEIVEGKPCGLCASCQTHMTALWQLDAFPREALFSL